MKVQNIAPIPRLQLIAFAGLFSFALIAGPGGAYADPVAELASFSIFDKVDLAQLAKSDVKTAHGAPMKNPRFLAVQSCYVVPGSPTQLMAALRRWEPTRHRELKVFLHSDLPSNPTPTNFEKLKNAPANASVRSFVTATQKLSSDLQISKEEAQKFSAAGAGGAGGVMPPAVVAFWADVLTARTRAFVSGGMAAEPPYNHAGPSVRASDEVNGLLRDQDKIRRQFSGLLGATGIGRGAGSLTPELYWELLDANDQGVVTLGASYIRSGAARNVSGRGRPVLRQRRLLCRAHASSAVACYGRRKTFHASLARRYDFVGRTRIAAWGRAAGLGVSNDEKYHQSCYGVSPRHRRSVNK